MVCFASLWRGICDFLVFLPSLQAYRWWRSIGLFKNPLVCHEMASMPSFSPCTCLFKRFSTQALENLLWHWLKLYPSWGSLMASWRITAAPSVCGARGRVDKKSAGNSSEKRSFPFYFQTEICSLFFLVCLSLLPSSFSAHVAGLVQPLLPVGFLPSISTCWISCARMWAMRDAFHGVNYKLQNMSPLAPKAFL